jgi:alpha-galactosidase
MSQLRPPDRIFFSQNPLQVAVGDQANGIWSHGGTEVSCRPGDDFLAVEVRATGLAANRVVLRWDDAPPEGARFLGDHWERGYGDLEWRGLVGERIMPWYFLCHAQGLVTGWGVRTGAGAMCHWTADANGVSLWLDLRNGTSGVRLGQRTLVAAEVVKGLDFPGTECGGSSRTYS